MHGIIDIPEYMSTWSQSCVNIVDTWADRGCREARKNENSLGRLLSSGNLGGTSVDATV